MTQDRADIDNLSAETAVAFDDRVVNSRRSSTVSISAADGTWSASLATVAQLKNNIKEVGESDNINDGKEESDAVVAKETYLWKAKLAQEAGRFEDMAVYMRLATETGASMSQEEDNLLAAAYKRVLDMKRSARRTLVAVEQKNDVTPWEAAVAQRYRMRVDAEMRALCAEMLTLVGSWLESDRVATADTETVVFYWKMRADYNRYAAEAVDADDPDGRTAAVAESRNAYERADQLGRHSLPPINPVRLGLMLNYSVFLYQVCKQHRQGHDLAKQAFDDALAEIDAMDSQMYDDATLILRLIRDNLSIWIAENGGSSFADDPPSVASLTMVSADDGEPPLMAEITPPSLSTPLPSTLVDDDSPSLWSFDDVPPLRHDNDADT